MRRSQIAVSGSRYSRKDADRKEEPDGTWRIVEVWDSDENRDRWQNETLLPTLQQHGVDITQGPPAWTRVEVRQLVTS